MTSTPPAGERMNRPLDSVDLQIADLLREENVCIARKGHPLLRGRLTAFPDGALSGGRFRSDRLPRVVRGTKEAVANREPDVHQGRSSGHPILRLVMSRISHGTVDGS